MGVGGKQEAEGSTTLCCGAAVMRCCCAAMNNSAAVKEGVAVRRLIKSVGVEEGVFGGVTF